MEAQTRVTNSIRRVKKEETEDGGISRDLAGKQREKGVFKGKSPK